MRKLKRGRLPPQTIRALARLPESDRKLKAADYLAHYHIKANQLHRTAERMAQQWVDRQADFFDEICKELRHIIDTGDLPEGWEDDAVSRR